MVDGEVRALVSRSIEAAIGAVEVGSPSNMEAQRAAASPSSVTDAADRGGIDLPDVLDSGRAIRFTSDFFTRGVGELTLYF